MIYWLCPICRNYEITSRYCLSLTHQHKNYEFNLQPHKTKKELQSTRKKLIPTPKNCGKWAVNAIYNGEQP